MASSLTRFGGQLCLIACVALATFGCGTTDDGTGGNNVGPETACISGGSSFDCLADIELRDAATGATVSFGGLVGVPVGNVATGGEIDLKFNVSNIASVATASLLEIRGIRVVYEAATPAEADGLAFQCFKSDGKTPCTAGGFLPVAPGGVSKAGWTNGESFIIRYKRYDDTSRSAKVYIKLAGDPDYFSKEYLIRFDTKAGSPKIKLSPEVLSFDQVAPDQKAEKKFTVVNSGDAILEITKIEFTAASAFTLITKDKKEFKPGELVLFDPPIAIPQNESEEFTIRFEPKDPHKKQGVINVVTNDSSPKAGELPILGNAKVPCMQLEPAGTVNFGGVKLGSPTPRQIRIKSCGGAELIVDKIEFGDAGNSDEFTFDFTKMNAKFPGVDAKTGPTKAKPLKIGINDEAIFEVVYTPEDESKEDPNTGKPKPDIAEVKLTNNAFDSKSSVLCEGIGVVQTCPTAKIKVQEGEEVIPQTMLHLKGDQSQPTGGGSIKKYKWTATQPGGSNQVFVPSSSFPNPTFTANAAGEYKFCLEVWDQSDQKSCAPACVTILVLPEEAVHVELLWKTPADPDETDTGPAAGADMDLHFAHPLAQGPDIDCDGKKDPWFSNPFDTFWFNPNPNWGSVNPNANDDPSLDLDDTDGAGPENLNLDEPEGKVGKPKFYHVGVHYWNDHGFGKSFATVNIYIMGVLALQIQKVEMNVLDMWYVGKINWPNSMSTTGITVDPFQICYATGDPCNKTKPGKYWVPQGKWCISHCYVNPAFTATQSGASASACKKP
ncbi:MAG: choice-of-anchor D domain-containing protein [Myxococcales bacterium]|nr:choice-of-anchor D domain-containing protein [Myxococcales bacterium]